MQGGFLIFTTLFSMWFMQRKIDYHHILGMVLCFAGLILVFLNQLYFNWTKDLIITTITKKQVLFGLVLVLLAMIINGIYFVS